MRWRRPWHRLRAGDRGASLGQEHSRVTGKCLGDRLDHEPGNGPIQRGLVDPGMDDLYERHCAGDDTKIVGERQRDPARQFSVASYRLSRASLSSTIVPAGFAIRRVIRCRAGAAVRATG